MKGSITHAQTVIIVLICVLIVLLISYLILYKNLIPTILNSLEFIIAIFQGTPPS
mgnify:CR=1 FL=1